MAFALHIETESSDDYMFVFDGEPSQKEIVEKIKEDLGEEFDYISDYHYKATYKIKFKL
jgi:hypothetical protein